MIAAEFEGVAPFDQAQALRGQALELDRFDLGAVLFELALALRLLVGVELALDALGLAVEQVDEGPEQIGGIVLEAGAGEQALRALRRWCRDGPRRCRSRASAADRARPGPAGSRTAPARRAGTRSARRRGVRCRGRCRGRGGGCRACHGGCLSAGGNRPRPSRPSRRSPGRGRRRGAPARAEATRRMARGSILFRDAKPARSSGRRRKMRDPAPLRRAQGGPVSGRPAAPADRRSGRPWRGPLLPAEGLPAARTNRLPPSGAIPGDDRHAMRAALIGGEAGEIGGDELGSEMREERGGAEGGRDRR